MADVNTPVTTFTVSQYGEAVFLAQDSEQGINITGDYEAVAEVQGNEYYVNLKHTRGTQNLTGWAIKKPVYAQTMINGTEILTIAATVDFEAMKLSGTIQRISHNGNVLGVYTLRGFLAPTMELSLPGTADKLILGNKIDSGLTKPAFSGGA